MRFLWDIKDCKFYENITRKTKKSNQKKIKERDIDIVVDKSTPMSTTTQQHTRDLCNFLSDELEI